MKNSAGRIGPGASTILLIIVVLCMTMFGVLAMVTADHDASIGNRVRENEAAYYSAQTEFGLWIKGVDEQILAFRAAAADDTLVYDELLLDAFDAKSGETITFSTDVAARQMEIEVEICALASHERYRILGRTLTADVEEVLEEETEWNLIS